MPPKQKALERQAAVDSERQRKADADREAAEAAAWSDGARDTARLKAAEDREMERLRKAAEKASLLAAEEADLSKVKPVTKTKKKGKDDFDMLNAAIASAPKTKAQKEKEAKEAEKKRADEERQKKEAEARERKEARLKAEQEEIRKAAARGIVLNHTDELFVPINNHLDEDDFEHASGLDGALDVLGAAGGGAAGKAGHPERRQKAAYNAYYERKLVELREELPGLKLSQYKERIFEMWKTDPENPHNAST